MRYFIVGIIGETSFKQKAKGIITLKQETYPNKSKIANMLLEKDIELLSFSMIQEVTKEDYEEFKR